MRFRLLSMLKPIENVLYGSGDRLHNLALRIFIARLEEYERTQKNFTMSEGELNEALVRAYDLGKLHYNGVASQKSLKDIILSLKEKDIEMRIYVK